VTAVFFWKLYGRNPIVTDQDLMEATIVSDSFSKRNGYYPAVSRDKDRKAQATIRRMFLDAFWSRAMSTVEANAKVIQRGYILSASIGLDPPYLAPGPLPSFDHCGKGVAIQMLLASQEPGHYSTVYK
jgi:hypothetical protein